MLGQVQHLQIDEICAEGAYLKSTELGDVFLAKAELDDYLEEGDSVRVFVYQDGQGHPVATTREPIAQVGDFALLRVNQINKIGAFLDIGLDKDVLAPYNEQKPKMREGYSYLVKLYLDNASKRICASSNLKKFLDKSEPNYKKFEEVDLIVASKTDIGFKVIINNQHTGVVFFNTIFKRMFIGQKLKGYVKHVREDGKIDIVLEKPGADKFSDLGDTIIEALKQNNGRLALGDKSSPDEIKAKFGTSKANFKKAIGGLYKKNLIDIEAKAISLK